MFLEDFFLRASKSIIMWYGVEPPGSILTCWPFMAITDTGRRRGVPCGRMGVSTYTTFSSTPSSGLDTRREVDIIIPLPHNAAFWRTKDIQLWKTLWEKEKFFVTSNFSFSHTVFYPIWHIFQCTHTLKCHLQFVTIWTSPTFCHLVKGNVHVYNIMRKWNTESVLCWRCLTSISSLVELYE